METPLLTVTWKREHEDGFRKATLDCGGPHDFADTLHQANDCEGAIGRDALGEAFLRGSMKRFAFALRQMVHGRQNQVVEIPPKRFKMLKKIAVRRVRGL